MHRARLFATLFLFTLLLVPTRAQDNKIQPRIDVNGMAEMHVVPDEIHIAIELRERGSGNSKVTVEQQEVQLRDAVKALGINLDNLTLSDAVADYVPKKFRKDDVVARKGYTLKVGDAEAVRKVFLELDRLQIEEARIQRVSHSKEQEFRKDMRIKAITAAKEKADYLLAAIGEKTGSALSVAEVTGQMPTPRAGVNRLMAIETIGHASSVSSYEPLGVNFSRIHIRAEVVCVFAIAAR
ncbi:MAG: SIMPL domain-containing protein [Flavobacteriales bacterium]